MLVLTTGIPTYPMSFQKISLPLQTNLFDTLLHSVHWEDQPKGRKVAVISQRNTEGHIPIVRTTSKYNSPAQHFTPIHNEIVEQIQLASGRETLNLNHATCEIYDHRYRTMKYHTDQALDIAPHSYICLFSCYENENETHPRILKIRNKETDEETVLELSHNSCVLFSEASNQAHVHKIEAAGSGALAGGRWMGLTFRLSKTLIRFTDGIPHFTANNVKLRMADEEEQREFFRFKGRENAAADHVYPELDFTISDSDLLPLGCSP